MTTIGELIQDNPFYKEGIIFNQDFYKDSLEGKSLTTRLSEQDLTNGYRLVVLTELIQKVATIALLIIPSIAIITLPQLLPLMGIALLQQIVIGSADEDKKDYSFFESLNLKSKLIASLDFKDQKRWFLSEVGISTAFKISLFAVSKYFPLLQRMSANMIIFYECSKIFHFLERKVFVFIATIVNERREKEFIHIINRR